MATMVSGSQGSVTIGGAEKGATISVTAWEATFAQDVFEDTPFSVTNNARTKSMGMSMLSGSITGWILDDPAPELGTVATSNAPPISDMILQTSSGDTLTFSAVTSMNVTVAKTGQAQCVLSFESSGEVVFA